MSTNLPSDQALGTSVSPSTTAIASEAPKAPTRKLTSEELTAIERKKFEDLLARARTLRESATLNAGEVRNGDPEYTYVWINRGLTPATAQAAIKFKALGYEIVSQSDPAETNWRQPDGTHVWGDVILSRIRKNMHEAFKIDSAIRATEAVEGSREGLMAFAQRNNLKLSDNSVSKVA